MNKYLIFILSATLFSSCLDSISGNGNVATEKRNVDHFNGIQTSGSIDVEVSYGEKLSVEVEADNNILPYIITEAKDGLLDVYYKEGNSYNNTHAKVYVVAPVLNKLFIKGSANITSKNTIKNTEFLEANIRGSGDINASVDAPEVKASISGSGNISLQGRCKNFEGNISGSGDLKCSDLLSENAMVSIAGSGNAHIYSSVKLKASSAGSGDIYYKGNPSSPEISKSGSGNIEPEN